MSSRLIRSRLLAYQSQGGRCHYCGVQMWLRSMDELNPRPSSRTQAAKLKCTAEHLIPRAEGGTDRAENIVAACLHCNLTRHRMQPAPHPPAYRTLVRKQLRNGGWHSRAIRKAGLLPSA